MLVKAQVGPGAYNDGANAPVSLGRQGDLIASELHGRYYTAAYRGFLFNAVTGSVTVASTHVSPLAAGTGTPIIGLWNPLNSGRNLTILKHGVATVSGTPGGPILWNFALNQNLTAIPNGTSVPGNISAASASIAKVFTSTALTGSTIGTALRHAALLPAIATAYNIPAMEEDAGDIIVPPGGMLTMAAFATGTSHVLQASITWAEYPL